MDDKRIIALMQSQPDKGIYEAIRKYEAILTIVVSRIVTRPQDVEECVSDTFLNVWQHVHALSVKKGSLKGYLIVTARNTAINRYKQMRRSSVVALGDEILQIPSLEDLEEDVLMNADTDTLLQIICEMEEPDREIVLRKHLLFEPVKDIAALLQMEPKQVKYKLQRAKSKLHKSLIDRGIAL